MAQLPKDEHQLQLFASIVAVGFAVKRICPRIQLPTGLAADPEVHAYTSHIGYGALSRQGSRLIEAENSFLAQFGWPISLRSVFLFNQKKTTIVYCLPNLLLPPF